MHHAAAAAAGGGEPKRVLLLTVPVTSHLMQMVRLAEWLLRHPRRYEVHIGAARTSFPRLPEGGGAAAAELHEMPAPLAGLYEAVCLGALEAAGAGRDEVDSQARMMSLVDDRTVEAWVGLNTFGFGLLDAVMPDLVICDHDYTTGNFLYTLCRSRGVGLIAINSMGRPAIMRPRHLLWMLLRHSGAVLRGLKALAVNSRLEAIAGPALPEREQPTTLYPSSHLLVAQPPEAHEIFTGPFLVCSGLPMGGRTTGSEGGGEPRQLPLRLRETPALESWLLHGGEAQQERPIVYVAFGTVVKPTPELVGRLLAALDGGPWRVLWAVPEVHRHLLPNGSKLSSQWHLESTFGVQAPLLESGLLRAFVSHGGNAGVHESLSRGVPMVCMPFFGDQYDWATAVCTELRAGILVDKARTSAEDLRQAVKDVLGVPEYRRNAENLAAQMAEHGRRSVEWLQQFQEELQPQRQPRLQEMAAAAAPRQDQGEVPAGVMVAAAVIEGCLTCKHPSEVLPAFITNHSQAPQRGLASCTLCCASSDA